MSRPLIALALCAACSSKPSAATGDPFLAAKTVEGRELALDLGQVFLGDSARQVVRLGNHGPGSIKVKSVAASPADTGLGFDPVALPLEILSGDEASLQAVFAPGAEGGASASVTFTLENATVPQVVADLTGTGVDGKCEIAPRSLDFGTVETGIAILRTVRVGNGSAVDWKVAVGVTAGDSAFQLVSSPGSLTVPAGGAVVVTLQMLSFDPGTFSGTLPLSSKLTCAQAKIALSATAIDQVLTWAPDPLAFGGVHLTATATATLTVRNASSTDLHLSSVAVTSQSAAFALSTPSATLTVPAQGMVEVGVVFHPAQAGDDTGQLTAQTDDPKRPSLSVALTGSGVP